jgi:hypothetical protein
VEKMLKRKLKGSTFSNPESIRSMTDAFENEVGSPSRATGGSSSEYARQLKRKFDGTMEKYDLTFGGIMDNDPSVGINNGKITLSLQDLKPIFGTVIDKIITSCSSVLKSQKTEVM